MINLEQVKLLESKVSKTIDFLDRISKENAALVQREAELQEKLEASQKRIEELEVLISGFKEEQSRVEDGILAALDRLSQFEEAIEKSLTEKRHSKADGSSKHAVKDSIKSPSHNSPQKAAAVTAAAPVKEEAPEEQSDSGAADDKICFEIPEEELTDDILDPLTDTLDEDAIMDGNSPEKGGELDIF